MSLSGHQKRLLTAAGLVILVAEGVATGGWFEFAVIALVSTLGLWEFHSMFWPGRAMAWAKTVLAALGLAFLLITFRRDPVWLVAAVSGLFWCVNLRFLIVYGRGGDIAYSRPLSVVAGLLYLPAPLHFFFHFSPPETVLVLAAAFMSDTAAYYAGSWFGKKKVWPAVSPKKTWAGCWGGLACCVAACTALGAIWGTAPWPAFLVLGLALGIAAQTGDFFESALKRSLEIKDSGRMLPGHGGILDRIDSLLLVTPVYAGARTLYALF